MLQSMRDLSKSWFFKTLMGLLIVSFAIWGIGDIFTGNAMQRTVAKIGHKAITVQTLQNEFQRTVKEARQNFGPEFTVAQANQMGLLDKTLELLIQKSLFDQDVAHLGIRINEQMVVDQLASLPQFRMKDGTFNRQMFQAVLRQNNMSEQSFLLNIREENARRTLFSTIGANSNVPQIIKDYMYRAEGQERILEVLSIPNDKIEDLPKASEDDLRQFYDKNGELFRAPEYRAVTILKLSAADVVKDISISEDDLKKAYETQKDSLGIPEQRDLVQVVLQDEEKAKAIATAAKADGDLTKAAKVKGFNAIALNKAEKQNTTLPELYEAIFSLGENAISYPIKSAMGWHVVQIKKIYEPAKPTFEATKEKLRATLKQDMSVESITRQVNQLDDALAAGQALEDLAESMKLRMIKIPALNAQGQSPEGKAPTELPGKDEVLKTAYAQSAGETSPVLEDKTASEAGDYLVVRTDDVTPSHIQPYAEVKAKVISAWKKDVQAQKAGEIASALAEQIRQGKAASSFEGQHGIEVRTSQPITMMGATDKSLPQQAMPQILRMKKNDVLTAQSADHRFVLCLVEIRNVDPAKPDSVKDKVATRLGDEWSMNLVSEYEKYLRQKYTVKINQSQLDLQRRQEN